MLGPVRLLTGAFLAAILAVPLAAQENTEQWTVVYIGETGLEEVTLVLSDHIETNFGIDVFYTQRNAGLIQVASKMLQTGAWSIVRDAEVVIVEIEIMNDRPGYCTDQPGDRPVNRAIDDIPSSINGFLQSLAAVANPQTQIIRIANEAVLPGNLARWNETGVVAECMEVLKGINEAWALGAEAYGFTLVDFYSAWNGSDGTVQPPSSFYKPDGKRLSAVGAKAAAELILEKGYQPLNP